MSTSRTNVRNLVVTALTLALLTGPFVAWQGANGDEGVASLAPRGIVVVGDSITARYNDSPGSAVQGWWSFVGRRYGASVTTYAQSGSGYLRPGLRCTGDRFIDRTRAYTGPAPSIFIVEGGRNDWSICKDGHRTIATDAEIEHAVDRYLGTLQIVLPQSTRIIVMGPPWGPRDQVNALRVTAIIEAVAARRNLEFISTTGALTANRVVDGIHPNRAGSRAIAAGVIRALGH